MKNIELTKEHKSKLLEMCKILFPEYPNLEVRNSMEDFCMEQEDCFIELQESGLNSRKDTIIHWFEFCMTHLCDKISTKLTNEMCTGMPQYYDESEKLDWNSQSLISMLKEYHPVDYLYEEFKKLK